MQGTYYTATPVGAKSSTSGGGRTDVGWTSEDVSASFVVAYPDSWVRVSASECAPSETATATGACRDARRGGGERAVGPGTSRSFASTEKSDPGGVGGDRLRKLGSFCEVVMGSPMGMALTGVSMMGEGGSIDGRKDEA